MRKTLLRAWFGVFVFACVLGLALSRHSGVLPVAAATPTPVASASATPTPQSPAYTTPGQSITNAASASYTDGSGNTFNILSNTVTVYVQNAPSLVVLTNNGTSTGAVTTNGLTPAASPVPGDYLSDVYTLVNTGNGSGYFQVAAAAAASPTPLPGTNNGVTQSGPETGVTYTLSCNGGAYNNTDSTVAALNTDLSTNCTGVGVNGSVNIAVNYQANATGTVNTQIEAQVIYPGYNTGTYAPASSLWVTNQYNDPVIGDERVDIQKSPGPIDSAGDVTYSIYANNGGNSPANYVNSYGATCSTSVKVCGAALTGPGIIIADKVPNGATTPLPVISMSPSPGPQALSSGETVTMVYTSDSSAKTGWTSYSGGGFPAGTAYVGVYLTGNGSRIGLPADPTPATTTGPGSVVAASSQIGWTMKIGPMPANLTVNNVITAPVGDNKQCIEGPGLTTTSTACDSSGPNPNPGSTSPGDPSIPLTTPAPSNSPIPGLSNTATVISPSLYNGPYNVPDAQGCFNSNATPVPFPTWSPMPNPFPTISPTTQPTCPATDNQDDFTQAVSTPNPSTTNMPYGAQMAAASTVTVTNSVKNPGAQSNTYQLTFPTLPSSVSVTSVTYGNGSCSTTSTPVSNVYPLGSIGAGNSIQYCVTYTTSTGASAPYYFQPIFVQLDVAYTSAPTVYYNNTWNVLMPGGFIEMAKTATVLSNGNCQFSITVPTNGVCPGGIIQYAVAYWNALPTSASGTPSEPAGASIAVNASGLVITEDGSANGSNWTTYTGGLFDPAGSGVGPLVASQSIASLALNCGVVTLKCGDTNATTFGGFTSPNGNLYGSTKFTDTIPTSVLTPQSGGVLMFAAKVH